MTDSSFHCRLLETDSKSLYSVNGVLRSPCSSKIFSFEEDSSTWSSVVENWDEWSKKKVKQLKVKTRNVFLDIKASGTKVFTVEQISK